MADWTPSLTGHEPTAWRYGNAVNANANHTWGSRSLRLQAEANPPKTRIYERLARISQYTNVLPGSVGIVQSPLALSRTFGGRSASVVDTEEVEFEVKNRRRIHLIERQLETELSPEETSELAELRASVVEAVNAQHPLPFDELDQLEAAARELLGGSD